MLPSNVCNKEPVVATAEQSKPYSHHQSSSSLVLLPLNGSNRNAKAKDHNARAGYGHLDLSMRHLQRAQSLCTYSCTALGLTLTPHTFWMLYICSAWM